MAIGILFPLLILGAGFAGWWLAPNSPPPPVLPDASPFSNRVARTGRTVLVWLAVWWLPLLIPGLLWGSDQIGARLGRFFSQTALVTFGGAYAVLPYVATRAQAEGWVTASEMLDGLALGETTPGPLVLVLQWIGFLAGWKRPAPFSPLGGATLGALITSWATFAPSFVWVFAGAPWMDPLRRAPGVGRFLQGVSAAVVGLIAALAVHLATAVWTTRAEPWSPDLWAIGLSLVAFAGLVLRRWPAAVVITACGLANWLRSRWL
jgi:chromate transporter